MHVKVACAQRLHLKRAHQSLQAEIEGILIEAHFEYAWI